MALPGVLRELAGRFASDAFGFGVGQAISKALDPDVQPLANESWKLNPSMPIDPQLAAQLHATGRDGGIDAKDDAAQMGTNGARFTALTRLALQAPATMEILELLRRGLIDEAEARRGFKLAGLEPDFVDGILSLRRYLLSPQDMAMARQQGFVSTAEARARSDLQGVDAADADLLFEMAGLPPGITEGMELLRRGEIDEARFSEIVREGHTKTKYTADLLKLKFQPLSPSIAAEAVVRERMSPAEGAAIAAKGGINAQDFAFWTNMLGRPMGVGEAQAAVNRGLMDAAGFREVVARSDVRTEYADTLYALRRRIPSLMQLERLIAAGAIPDAYAKELVIAEGYDPALADHLVAAGHRTKAAKHHDLSVSNLETLHAAGMLSTEQATADLLALGYDEAEAAALLTLLDARREIAARNRAITVVHAKFVSHAISEEMATGDLDQLLADPNARNVLMTSWKLERQANVKRLTAGQVALAFKWSIITANDAAKRLVELGYPTEDAQILLEIASKGPLTPLPEPV